jgi:hypothetical protein
MADHGLVLRVVEMDGDGDGGARCRVGCCADKETIGEGDGPGEDLDDEGGAFAFGGFDAANYVLDVVAEGKISLLCVA